MPELAETSETSDDELVIAALLLMRGQPTFETSKVDSPLRKRILAAPPMDGATGFAKAPNRPPVEGAQFVSAPQRVPMSADLSQNVMQSQVRPHATTPDVSIDNSRRACSASAEMANGASSSPQVWTGLHERIHVLKLQNQQAQAQHKAQPQAQMQAPALMRTWPQQQQMQQMQQQVQQMQQMQQMQLQMQQPQPQQMQWMQPQQMQWMQQQMQWMQPQQMQQMQPMQPMLQPQPHCTQVQVLTPTQLERARMLAHSRSKTPSPVQPQPSVLVKRKQPEDRSRALVQLTSTQREQLEAALKSAQGLPPPAARFRLAELSGLPLPQIDQWLAGRPPKAASPNRGKALPISEPCVSAPAALDEVHKPPTPHQQLLLGMAFANMSSRNQSPEQHDLNALALEAEMSVAQVAQWLEARRRLKWKLQLKIEEQRREKAELRPATFAHGHVLVAAAAPIPWMRAPPCVYPARVHTPSMDIHQ